MNLQNIHTSFKIRLFNDNPAVKTSRTQKRRIQDLRPVRRRQQHKPLIALESVHLRQQLV